MNIKHHRSGMLWMCVVVLMMCVSMLQAEPERENIVKPDETAKEVLPYDILLLDDSDSEFKGKGEYDDRLYLLDQLLNIKGVFSGFNITPSVGAKHHLAVDSQRKTLWVADNYSVWHFNLDTGDLLQKIPNVRASSIAIDPATGNAWVLTSDGTIDGKELLIFSSGGTVFGRYPIMGVDIAYSPVDNCFWITGKSIYKVALNGKIQGQIENLVAWCAVSLSIDHKTGNVWILERAHPQVLDSGDRLWIIDRNVQVRQTIDLGDVTPLCVSVDSENEVVWVGCKATTLRFSTSGLKLPSARQVSAFCVIPGSSKNHVVAADGFYNLFGQYEVQDSNLVFGNLMSDELNAKLSRNPKWLAYVPFSGAKLNSDIKVETERPKTGHSERSEESDKLTPPPGIPGMYGIPGMPMRMPDNPLQPDTSVSSITTGQKYLPDGTAVASLVNRVRESENWIHKVNSFYLKIDGSWSDSIDRTKKSTDILEFAFDKNRVCSLYDGPHWYSLRMWTGNQYMGHEKTLASNDEFYILHYTPQKKFKEFIAGYTCWPRSQPHSFWFDLKDVNLFMDIYGQAEEFVFTEKTQYHGIDCYSLSLPSRKLDSIWFVGVKDGLLHGSKSIRDGKLQIERWMLDYKEVASDCWLPFTMGYQFYNDNEQSDSNSCRELKVVECTVNQPLPDDLFQINFKEGVTVHDQRYGQLMTYPYKADRTEQELIELMLKSGIKENADSKNQQPETTPSPKTK